MSTIQREQRRHRALWVRPRLTRLPTSGAEASPAGVTSDNVFTTS